MRIRRIKGMIATFALLAIVLAKYGNREVMQEYKDVIINAIPSVHAEADIDGSKEKSADCSGSVVRVVDGDTFVLNINGTDTKVRLIGIDTPESVSNSDKLVNTDYGKKASDYVKSLLPEGTKVTLKYDKEKTDVYGRTLVYMYTKINGKNVMVNKHLVKKGYARAVYYSPNGKPRKELKKLHINAKKKRAGFWKEGKTAAKGFKMAFPTKNEKEY